jgi:uncharacterized alpha/beta hydrolase family protein
MRLMANVRAVLHHSLQVNKKAQHNSLHQDRFSVEVVHAVLLNTPQG